MNVCSAPSDARIRSAFVTETVGKERGVAVRTEPGDGLGRQVAVEHDGGRAVEHVKVALQIVGVMAAEMSVSHRPSCSISPRSSVMYRYVDVRPPGTSSARS